MLSTSMGCITYLSHHPTRWIQLLAGSLPACHIRNPLALAALCSA